MSRCSLRGRDRQAPERYDPAAEDARPQLMSPKRRKKTSSARPKGSLTYLETCVMAIKERADRTGSSARSIEKYIVQQMLQVPFKRHLLRAALNRGVVSAVLKTHPHHAASYILVAKKKKKVTVKIKKAKAKPSKKKDAKRKRRRSATKAKKKTSGGFTFGGSAAFSFGSPAHNISSQQMLPPRSDVDLKGYSYGDAPAAAEEKSGELDVVFCLDCTGSMGSTIAACQKDIKDLVNQLQNSEGQDVRFGLIPYRDHKKNNTYCTKVYPFTRDVRQMLANVNAQSAQGGGDYPEAVTAALFEAVCIDWRDSAAKLVIFMADAGPHGLGEGNEHPNGDPDGKDPLALAREAVSLGVCVYSLIVGHCSVRSRWFFAALSDITGGQAMKLSSAAKLGEAILEGAKQSLELERGVADVRGHIAGLEEKKGRVLTEKERKKATSHVLKRRNSDASDTRTAPASVGSIVGIPPERLAQAKSCRKFSELSALWQSSKGSNHSFSAGMSTAVAHAPTSSAAAAAACERITRMAGARDARSTDKVLVECIADGKKVRARVLSEGYDKTKNCQFPRAIRAVGKKFLVDTVVDAGSFYRVKGAIVPYEE